MIVHQTNIQPMRGYLILINYLIYQFGMQNEVTHTLSKKHKVSTFIIFQPLLGVLGDRFYDFKTKRHFITTFNNKQSPKIIKIKFLLTINMI